MQGLVHPLNSESQGQACTLFLSSPIVRGGEHSPIAALSSRLLQSPFFTKDWNHMST